MATISYFNENSTSLTNTTKLSNPPSTSGLSRNTLISFVINISIVIISLIGNPLTMCVVLRKRFRSTSTGFYILCLAFYDTLYTIFWPLETATKVSDSDVAHWTVSPKFGNALL